MRGEGGGEPRLGLGHFFALTDWVLIACVTAGAFSAFLPREYRATAKILPTRSASLRTSLFDLAAAGLGDDFSGGVVGEYRLPTYPELILSASVLDNVVNARVAAGPATAPRSVLAWLDASGGSERELRHDGLKRLRAAISVEAEPKTGIISISTVMPDSVVAAFVTNRIVEELNAFNVESRSSQGRETRQFIEGRLAEAKTTLVAAETALSKFRSTNLRIGNSPPLQMDLERLERELATRVEMYRLLLKQYEMARIEERRDTPTFSVLEAATPPVKKYRPKLLLNAALGGVAAFGLLLAYTYLGLQFRLPAVPMLPVGALLRRAYGGNVGSEG